MLWWVLILAAAPTATASRALELQTQKEWDALYLAFAAAQPAAYPRADRLKISKALTAGCLALGGDDVVMAYSLGEKAVAFTVTPEGALCAAMAAHHAEQPAAAETILRSGVAAYPQAGELWLELGRSLHEEGDVSAAMAAWSRVPKKSPHFAQAQKLKSANTTIDELAPLSPDAPSHSFESSVDDDGRRVRANDHFRFRYFNGQRDFGQRAEYEGAVQASLERAQQASQRILGLSRQSPLDVILYSRQEFALHHGPYAAASVAGFYSSNAIRMNDSAEVNAQNQATLVHEYVHAVVDELSGFQSERLPMWVHEGLAEWVEWQFEGGDAAPVVDLTALRALALGHSLPKLSSMHQDPLISQANPRLAYAFAAMAVRSLAALGGLREVLAFIREVGAGSAFDTAFKSHFGRDVKRFEEALAADLASR